MFKSIISVLMFVENVRQSRDWYCKFFNLLPQEDSESFVSFRIGNAYFNLHPADKLSRLSTGGSVVYCSVDDFDQAIQRAIDLGGRVYRGPLEIKENSTIIAQILDPFGNVFGLQAAL